MFEAPAFRFGEGVNRLIATSLRRRLRRRKGMRREGTISKGEKFKVKT
jgi:hypothetical protein